MYEIIKFELSWECCFLELFFEFAHGLNSATLNNHHLPHLQQLVSRTKNKSIGSIYYTGLPKTKKYLLKNTYLHILLTSIIFVNFLNEHNITRYTYRIHATAKQT